jgi:hypothetical protein
MTQLTHCEKGLDLGPLDEAAAVTMKGPFTTFSHHQEFNEDVSDDASTLACKGAEAGKAITTARRAWRAWGCTFFLLAFPRRRVSRMMPPRRQLVLA